MQMVNDTDRWATVTVEENAIRFELWEPAAADPDLVDSETVPVDRLHNRVMDILGVHADDERDVERPYRWLEIDYGGNTIHVDLFHYHEDEERPLLADTVDIDVATMRPGDEHLIGDGEPLDP